MGSIARMRAIAASSLRIRAERRPSLRHGQQRPHPPGRRTRCGGRAGIASARAQCRLQILPLSTYFLVYLKKKKPTLEMRKNLLETVFDLFREVGPLRRMAFHFPLIKIRFSLKF